MEDDQQFCLRWNNHQSTLVAVFDSLLERGQHVDVTLAAEGRTLRAHKVVLSACSPYFESVLSQQYDKHPIIILKDVKFAELRAMMDYMYRGEVNISQDQLGALLKAAESLQIKGLSDNKQPPPPTPPVLSLSPPPMKMPCLKESPCIDGEEESREGSISPTRRKRKKHRPSNSPINEMPRQSTPPATITNCSNTNPDDAELKSKPMDNIDAPATLTKTENNIDTNIEPKSEYGEDGIDDSVEDLTMEDEMDSEAEQGGIGSSQPIGDGSTQGYQWQTDRSHDEFNIGQDGQRDSQGESSQGTKIKNDSLKGSARNIDGPNLEYSDHGLRTVLEMSSILSQVQKLSGGISPSLLSETGPALSTSNKVKLIQDNITQNNNIIIKESQDFKALQKCEIESDVEYDDIDDILLPDESEVFGTSFTSGSGEDDFAMTMNSFRIGNTSGDRLSEPLPQFECRHCGKRYRWKSTLRRHESVECGGKPPSHACPYCQYRAKQRGNLGVHIRKHHNAEWGTFATTKIRKTKREPQSIKFE